MCLKLKWAVYKSYVRPTFLYGNEAWCLKESEMGNFQRTKRSMVRAICGVQLKDRERTKFLMLRSGLGKTLDQLAIENSVLIWSYVKEGG